MKKAKIMLAAIGVLALVGGVMAFKAAKFGPPIWYCTLINGVNSCVPSTLGTIINGTPVSGIQPTLYFTTTVATAGQVVKCTVPGNPNVGCVTSQSLPPQTPIYVK